MEVGYEYFFKDNLKKQLELSHKKYIGKYHYSFNSFIHIAHEKINKNKLEFDYLIFEYVLDGKIVKSKESILKSSNFIYHEIQKEMEFFFYGIYASREKLFNDEKWFDYAYMMTYESLYKESKAFVTFVNDFVFSFKIWNKLSDYTYTTISNFYKNKSSISRVCLDIDSDYNKNNIKNYLDEIMIYHINKCLNKDKLTENKFKNKKSNHDSCFNEHLHEILLKTI